MVYDKAKYHIDGLPSGVPVEQAFVHIAFFFTWAIDNQLHNTEYIDFMADGIKKLRNREIKPVDFALDFDGVLIEDMFTKEGNQWARYYYGRPSILYISDFCTTFDCREPFEVEPSWENYEKMAAVISRNHDEWKSAGCPKSPQNEGPIRRFLRKFT